VCYFFFQAEDGIRDRNVTGVQTCALPIFPNITEHQEKYVQEVCEQLSDVADWKFPRAARNREDIEDILAGFNHQKLDGVMIVMLTYSPAMRSVRALQRNNLPLLLANIQPEPEVTTDLDMVDITYHQGIHGVPDWY